MNKLILAILLLLPVAANAQRISALGTTNVAAGTNVIALVVAPNVTNGTRQITVANLFSNATARGFVTLTNLNGVTVDGMSITNTGGNVTNLFIVAVRNDESAIFRLTCTFSDVDYAGGGGFDKIAAFYNDNGTLDFSGGSTNLYNNTLGGLATNGFFISGTNVIVRAYSGNTHRWRARLEVLHSPP